MLHEEPQSLVHRVPGIAGEVVQRNSGREDALDEFADETLQESLEGDTTCMRDLLVDLHRRAECLGLRVLVASRQFQPQQLMAEAAGISRCVRQ
ncbi:hypothetical protein [Streptomyces hypolithicus]